VLDFTSALYLGMHHASRALRPWPQLTTGLPASLAVPSLSRTLAQQLARLQGCESATLATSTLHLAWDVFGMLSKDAITIYMDAGVYPIVRWGVERARAAGVPVRKFAHHNVKALQQCLWRDRFSRRIPVIVADGLCPECGKVAPLAEYLECMHQTREVGLARDMRWKEQNASKRKSDFARGYLILDDTQALGILGSSPSRAAPYGMGGGGSLQWANLLSPKVLMFSSLAKGFGAPLAVLSGSKERIRRFEHESETRRHCSPPSHAALHAVEHALTENEANGEALRSHLAQLVRHFQTQLHAAGFETGAGLFPMQILKPSHGIDGRTLHERLLRKGVRTILQAGRNENEARVSFVLSARHQFGDIDRAVQALCECVKLEDRNMQDRKMAIDIIPGRLRTKL
jgi:8-amino-7-oxononanoate synthase